MQKMQTRDILNTLSIILRLRNTINVNGLLYGIRRLPIIGKLISDRIYGIRFIKILALIHSFNTEIFKAFAGKLFFLLVILSGIFLAIFKRFRSRALGMRRTTKLTLTDRVGMYALWSIFPLRWIAEGFTAGVAGGSFMTIPINMLLKNLQIERKVF